MGGRPRLPTTHYLLRTSYYSLPTTYCLLLTAHYPSPQRLRTHARLNARITYYELEVALDDLLATYYVLRTMYYLFYLLTYVFEFALTSCTTHY